MVRLLVNADTGELIEEKKGKPGPKPSGSQAPKPDSPEYTKLAAGKGIRASPRGGRRTAEAAKVLFLKVLFDESLTVQEALRYVGRKDTTYRYWRQADPTFKAKADHILGLRRRKRGEREPVPPFPGFCEKYLGLRLFWHHLQWVDMIEGREPRDMHPAQRYHLGTDPNLVMVNVPPAHAKSTIITAAYTLWRMLEDPNSQIVIVSSNESQAKKWMFQIQDWLTSSSYSDLQMDFGPNGGFEKTSPVWNKTQIYFGDELRDENAKDPTLEVLGMGGKIYGSRADLIILDDIVEEGNAHDYDKQITWLTGMVLTRPQDEDKVLIVGTRMAPVDLYKELLNSQRYDDEESPWTYFASPAVLEFTETTDDWLTLWPRSNIAKKGRVARADENGLFAKWDGPALARMRKRISTDPYAWSLKYQQEDVSLDTIFPRNDVYGCVDGMRHPGPLVAGAPEHPVSGMDGLYVVGGFDPASEGFSAAVVIALDRNTGHRWVLAVHNQANMQPRQVRALITSWTKQYGILEWRIEKVLLSSWIMQDKEIVQDLANLGCSMLPHQTTPGTKWDPDAGVMGMSGLFKGWDTKDNMISLPSPRGNENVRALTEQLVNYFPKTRGHTDTLMALWFAEVRCRELVSDRGFDMYQNSEYISQRGLESRRVVDLAALDMQADQDYEMPRWWT